MEWAAESLCESPIYRLGFTQIFSHQQESNQEPQRPHSWPMIQVKVEKLLYDLQCLSLSSTLHKKSDSTKVILQIM